MKRILFGLLGWMAVGFAAAAAGGDRLGPAAANEEQASARAASPALRAIQRAAAARKLIFVFFWKEQNPQTDKAWGVLRPAVAKLGPWADVAAVRVTDPAERQIVERYGVSRAPMPLVLAIAPCGAVTKGFTRDFSEAQLRTALVSPSTQLCLKALQDRKLVLLCVVDQLSPQDPAAIPKGVRDFQADQRFAAATEIVLAGARDEGEAGLLKELGVEPKAPKPMTVLLAPPGTVIGRFDARATKEQLVAKLSAAQSNPCAGGKCGPGGCGPKK